MGQKKRKTNLYKYSYAKRAPTNDFDYFKYMNLRILVLGFPSRMSSLVACYCLLFEIKAPITRIVN